MPDSQSASKARLYTLREGNSRFVANARLRPRALPGFEEILAVKTDGAGVDNLRARF